MTNRIVLSWSWAALPVGLLFVALPWIAPWIGAEPVVLPATFDGKAEVAAALRERLLAHDAACARGDVNAHAEIVSAASRSALQRTAAAFDRDLDAAMLRSGSDGDRGLAQLLTRGACRGFADGGQACLVGRAAAGLRGSSGVLFVKVGTDFRIERVVHMPGVDPKDEAAVAAFARALLSSSGS